MNWELHLRGHVKKTIRRLSEKDRMRIAEALKELRSDPYMGDIEKLEGEENSWRRRIGAFRITYEVDAKEKIIRIFKIKRRTSTTYRKR